MHSHSRLLLGVHRKATASGDSDGEDAAGATPGSAPPEAEAAAEGGDEAAQLMAEIERELMDVSDEDVKNMLKQRRVASMPCMESACLQQGRQGSTCERVRNVPIAKVFMGTHVHVRWIENGGRPVRFVMILPVLLCTRTLCTCMACWGRSEGRQPNLSLGSWG